MDDVVIDQQANFGIRIDFIGTILGKDRPQQGDKAIAVFTLAIPVSQPSGQKVISATAITFDILARCEDLTLAASSGPATNELWQQVQVDLIFVEQEHSAFLGQFLTRVEILCLSFILLILAVDAKYRSANPKIQLVQYSPDGFITNQLEPFLHLVFGKIKTSSNRKWLTYFPGIRINYLLQLSLAFATYFWKDNH